MCRCCFKDKKPVSETPEAMAMREVAKNTKEHIAADEPIHEESGPASCETGPTYSAVPPATSAAGNYVWKDSGSQQERAGNPNSVPQPSMRTSEDEPTI